MPAFSPPDEYGVVHFGDMRLGLVEIGRLEQRRDNPRAMSDQEYETLKRSMDRFGFKSFIVAEEIEPGRFGVIDGHHRWKAAQEQHRDRVPIVILDAQPDKAWMDLAMLTFNVTGDPVDDKFVDLLAELTKSLGAETTADFTALDSTFLATFGQHMDEAMAAFEAGQQAAGEAGSNPEQGGREGAWQGRPIGIELPRTPEVQALLDAVVRETGEAVMGQAVLKALAEWLKSRQPAQDTSTEEST